MRKSLWRGKIKSKTNVAFPNVMVLGRKRRIGEGGPGESHTRQETQKMFWRTKGRDGPSI